MTRGSKGSTQTLKVRESGIRKSGSTPKKVSDAPAPKPSKEEIRSAAKPMPKFSIEVVKAKKVEPSLGDRLSKRFGGPGAGASRRKGRAISNRWHARRLVVLAEAGQV